MNYGGLGGLEGKESKKAKLKVAYVRTKLNAARVAENAGTETVQMAPPVLQTPAKSGQSGQSGAAAAARSNPQSAVGAASTSDPKQNIAAKNKGDKLRRANEKIESIEKQLRGLQQSMELLSAQSRAVTNQLRGELQGVDNELAILQEKLEKYMSTNRNEHAEALHGELTTYAGGRYADVIRRMWCCILTPLRAASSIVSSVSQLAMARGALRGPTLRRLEEVSCRSFQCRTMAIGLR